MLGSLKDRHAEDRIERSAFRKLARVAVQKRATTVAHTSPALPKAPVVNVHPDNLRGRHIRGQGGRLFARGASEGQYTRRIYVPKKQRALTKQHRKAVSLRGDDTLKRQRTPTPSRHHRRPIRRSKHHAQQRSRRRQQFSDRGGACAALIFFGGHGRRVAHYLTWYYSRLHPWCRRASAADCFH